MFKEKKITLYVILLHCEKQMTQNCMRLYPVDHKSAICFLAVFKLIVKIFLIIQHMTTRKMTSLLA